jgi:hypothetical protein
MAEDGSTAFAGSLNSKKAGGSGGSGLHPTCHQGGQCRASKLASHHQGVLHQMGLDLEDQDAGEESLRGH